ncbi:MAG: zf-TFIIB domain-containing protein [Salinibacterium sp.]|nr:zf-TFIIB domain-containing protein [Salinibacterium sp.]
MKCPIDETQLVMSERSGIEIDYCPQCRGVWLDRGELDKIIDRSVDVSAGTSSQPIPPSQQPQSMFGRGGGHHGNSTDKYGRPRKKESWLSELFD